MKKPYFAGTVGVMLAMTAGATPSFAVPSTSDTGTFAFSIADIRSGRIIEIGSVLSTKSGSATSGGGDLAVGKSPKGTVAIVDKSLLQKGITTAATPSFVDISWDAYSAGTRYTVTRDGKRVASLQPGVSKFRDTSVASGKVYRYNVVPASVTDVNAKARMWSMKVSVPTAGKSLQSQASSRMRTLAAAATTTVSWITFIPQRRIDAPPAGCDYGKGYEFGGDDHGFDWRSSKFRTAVHAVVNWSDRSVTGNVAIGTTHVYKKGSNTVVAKKTASGSSSYAKKQAAGTATSIPVRMVTHASNPFCKAGAIDGALSIELTKGGNYSIFSGNHRQMPNHHVYIYDGGAVIDVYRKTYVNALCLVGPVACPLANFYGSGSF